MKCFLSSTVLDDHSLPGKIHQSPNLLSPISFLVQTNQMELVPLHQYFHRTSLTSLNKSLEAWFNVQLFLLLDWKPLDDKNHELVILNPNFPAQRLAHSRNPTNTWQNNTELNKCCGFYGFHKNCPEFHNPDRSWDLGAQSISETIQCQYISLEKISFE